MTDFRTDFTSSHPLCAANLFGPAVPPELTALRSSPGRPTTPAEARELAALTKRLAGAPARSETERFGAASLCQKLPRSNGSREAFLALARVPEFWSRASHAERATIAQTLGKSRSSAEAARLGKAYQAILPAVLFAHASTEGRRNALTQPLRAAAVVRNMSFRSHHLSGDEAQMRAVAERYARSEWNTESGRAHLTSQLLMVAHEVLSRGFEDRRVLMHWKGESEWIGERFTNLGGRDTWAAAAHNYVRARKTEDQCGLFQGDRSHCVTRSVP